MFPVGHISVGYLLYAGWCRGRLEAVPAPGPTRTVVVCSLLPDLVDKPLAWGLGILPTGRSLAHSLLVLVPLCLAVVLITRRRGYGEYGVAVALGTLSHPVVDALPVLWTAETRVGFLLWPYWSVEPYESAAPTLADLVTAAIGSPTVLLELFLFVVAVAVWTRQGRPGLTERS